MRSTRRTSRDLDTIPCSLWVRDAGPTECCDPLRADAMISACSLGMQRPARSCCRRSTRLLRRRTPRRPRSSLSSPMNWGMFCLLIRMLMIRAPDIRTLGRVINLQRSVSIRPFWERLRGRHIGTKSFLCKPAAVDRFLEIRTTTSI